MIPNSRICIDSDSLVLALEPTLKVLCAENVPGLCPRDVLIEVNAVVVTRLTEQLAGKADSPGP